MHSARLPALPTWRWRLRIQLGGCSMDPGVRAGPDNNTSGDARRVKHALAGWNFAITTPPPQSHTFFVFQLGF